ncbi:MAG: DUF1648 domain-containing protein [bacterium]
MEFEPARLDRTATVVSILVTAFLLGLSIFFIIKVPWGWIFAIFMMVIPLMCYLWSPKKYVFKNDLLIIEKIAGRQISIRLSDIEAYVRIPNFIKLKVARTFGNGGLFGFYGFFSTAEYGEINCQLTSLKDIIIIKTKKMNYALSPINCEDLEQYLIKDVRGLTGNIESLKPRTMDKKILASPMILILPAILFIALVTMVLLNYSQLSERIAVHFNTYGQPDRWGARSSYLISGLIPSTILFLLTIGVFFFVRKTTNKPAIPNFLVIIMSFILLFTACTSLATFWINKYGEQLIPMYYGIIIFGVLLIALLFFYYQKIVKN